METRDTRIDLTPELFTPAEVGAQEAERITGPSIGFWGDAWRRLKKNRVALVSAALIFLVIALAFFGPYLTPYTAFGQDLNRQSSRSRSP